MNTVDQMFLVGVESLALAFVGLTIYRRVFRRYLYLSLYTVSMVVCDAVRLISLRTYGPRSLEYFYTYFGSDVCLVMLRCLVVVSFFEIVLRESPLRKQARVAFYFFFMLVAAMSYGFTSNSVISNATIFYKRLLVELQQNMYFGSVVLVALLCVALAHLRVKDPQVRMLICGLGVSGALQASGWAMQNLMSKDHFHEWWGVIRVLAPFSAVALLSLWCYAVACLPSFATSPSEDARDASSIANPILVPAFMKAEARG